MENVLPACKNLGVTHITNGCYRLHPVEWNIGEAAGGTGEFALDCREPPRQIRKKPALLQDFQRRLHASGVDLGLAKDYFAVIEWASVSPCRLAGTTWEQVFNCSI